MGTAITTPVPTETITTPVPTETITTPVPTETITTPTTGEARPGRQGPRVVVVGAGFGGLAALGAFRGTGAQVTLVDRNGFHTFQPLLYQVATGGLNSGDVAYPARAAASADGARYRQAEVLGVDWDRRRVRVDMGEDLPFDYLVLAAGAAANYFGIPGAEEHSLSIYSIGTALRTRDRLFAELERAAAEPRRRPCSVVVVGGGPTGVEMAGTLAEIRNGIPALGYPELSPSDVQVLLVERADCLLAPFHPALRRYAERELQRRGVQLRLRRSVQEVRAGRLVLDGDEILQPVVVVWAAGVRAPALAGRLGLAQGSGGRITVDADLRVPDHPEVFVVGDLADVRGTEAPVPQLAQPAIQAGRHATEQIVRLWHGQDSVPFRYHDKGVMATIGRRSAVVQLPSGLRMTGWPAWLAWVGLHVVTLLGRRNRLAVLANLAWRYVAWPRRVKVIVGS